MKTYLNLVNRILTEGELRPNRTGIDTLAIPGAVIEHDMSEGFPLLTTKHMFYKGVRAELEFFIKGITDKKWLQDRGVHIWDEWCRPDKVPYSNNDSKQQAKMREERDLGPVYGWQWRNFGAKYPSVFSDLTIGTPCNGNGRDQLATVVKSIKETPDNRRMIVSAWNPVDMPQMALPPCHWGFEVLVINRKLHLLWNIRSVDVALGMPFNIASYATLLHLLAKEGNYEEGKLVGFCGDTHIYVNHLDGLKEQLTREPYSLPKIITENFKSVFDWQYTDTRLENYQHHPKIHFDIAI
jgi:thymidylate synthase